MGKRAFLFWALEGWINNAIHILLRTALYFYTLASGQSKTKYQWLECHHGSIMSTRQGLVLLRVYLPNSVPIVEKCAFLFPDAFMTDHKWLSEQLETILNKLLGFNLFILIGVPKPNTAGIILSMGRISLAIGYFLLLIHPSQRPYQKMELIVTGWV